MNKLVLVASFLAFSIAIGAQPAPKDWMHMSADKDNYQGVRTYELYKKLIKDRKGAPVVVAVLDSGVDFDHEDLKDVMWVNYGEIPEDGIDNDNNGYVDDIHGWNFIGGPNGNINQDTYEVTRLYKKLKYKYEDADPNKLNRKQKKEYEKYLAYKEAVMDKQKKAKAGLERMEATTEKINNTLAAVEKLIGAENIDAAKVESLDPSENADLAIAKNILNNFLKQAEEGETLNLHEVKEELMNDIQKGKDYYQGQLDYAYNPDFDPRHIVGDNPTDYSNRNYGNNDVEGPDAFHGTHVAGIIAAARGNDVGMDGIANNVQIMSVRTVPDGDERDKDVANAIFYAVDNGASIINMSFGKGYSPGKKYVDEAVKYAMKNDVLLVHAAGNSSQNNDIEANFPNDKFKKGGWFAKKYANNWIEVGALSYKPGEDQVATFSNYGKKNVDLFSPGVQIWSTTPDDNYQMAQGTSMASPAAAGVAAIIRSYFPELSASQVREVLLASCTRDNTLVKVPGTDEKKPFSELSVAGGTVDAYKAFEIASRMASKGKGKKKAIWRKEAMKSQRS